MEVLAEYLSSLQLLIKGILVGIIASAPMGPVGVLCIQRTIKKGRAYGLVTGAGAALSDLIYAFITGCGMSFVIDFIDNEQNLFVMKLMGSIMLFIFGIYMFRTNPEKSIRPTSKKKGTLLHNFITAFLVTFSNPLIIFLFIALFNMFTFVIPSDNVFAQGVGYFSIILGAMIWWFALTYIMTKMKEKFSIKGIQWLNRTIGSIVLFASIIYAIMTIFKLSLF